MATDLESTRRRWQRRIDEANAAREGKEMTEVTFCGPLGGMNRYGEYDMNITWECHHSALQFQLYGILAEIADSHVRVGRWEQRGNTRRAENLRRFIAAREELATRYRGWIAETPCTHANPADISDIEQALPACTCSG